MLGRKVDNWDRWVRYEEEKGEERGEGGRARQLASILTLSQAFIDISFS